jgi:TRAP-type C4-dicarboxylate transport system permease large subunit
MAVTIWGTASSWTLTALPLFVWMGEILFRTRCRRTCSAGLAPWLERVPGGCCTPTSSAARSSRRCPARPPRPCATIGKMTLPELQARGYPEDITIGTLAGAARSASDPAVDHHDRVRRHANVSIAQLFIAA